MAPGPSWRLCDPSSLLLVIPCSGAMGRRVDGPPVLVGRILAPVGVQGEVRVELFSDVPQRFAPGAVLSIEGTPSHVQLSRHMTRGLVVKFQGVDSRKAAEALRGKELYVPEGDVPPPPEDTYYYFQVLGMRVVTVQGEEVGVVTDILTTGANDVYVVRREDKETLVPALADVVVEVDVEDRRITVSLPDGL